MYSALVKAALAAVKYTLAWRAGSIALAADASHSLCDVVMSVGILVGLRFAERKSRHFPHGLHKIENLSALFVSLAIFYTGYEIICSAALNAGNTTLTNAPLGLAGALLGAIVMWVLARYEKSVAWITGSPSVMADAQHNKVDVFSSLLAGVGIAVGMAGLRLEWLAAVSIALIIFGTGARILLDAAATLLDGNLDEETLGKARDIILSQPAVVSIRTVCGRNSGSHKILELDLEINARDQAAAHAVSEMLEQTLQREIPRLDRVFIHYEPDKAEHADTSGCPGKTADTKNNYRMYHRLRRGCSQAVRGCQEQKALSKELLTPVS
jgi:cation diffusion facilitator family transporter